jgi:hypothetical protein
MGNAGLISTKLCCIDERMISNDMCTVVQYQIWFAFGFEFHAETEAEYWAVTAHSREGCRPVVLSEASVDIPRSIQANSDEIPSNT